ncbi:unnamed protein product [Peniophora sp. CBMAI 1063]|nr:unnamed protein product [Peniophora sp. CBMAI 1063]
MAPPPPPNIIVVPCHFCPTRVAVPPGQPPGAPLLCKPCFERAIRDKQKQTPPLPGSAPPQSMAHRPGPRPPPLPRQVSLSNQANIRIAHSLSPVTPTFAKRPSMAIPQHPIPSSRMLTSATPPSASPRLHHTNSGGPIALPATPPFLPVATPSPASLPAATTVDDDSDSDDLQLLYPESDDESTSGDPAPASEATTIVSTEKTPASSTDTPAPSSTPAIPQLWTDELSELSSLSDPDSSADESESADEPLMISIKRRRVSSSGLKIRIRIPSGFKFGQENKPQALAGAPPRPCGMSSCKRTVEAKSRWKLCTVCRSKYRKYQRKRIGVVNPRWDLEDEEPEPAMVHTQDAEINTAEAAAHALLSKEESRKCSNPWCSRRIPFENEYEYKQCIKCRVRGRWNVKKRRIISKHYDRGKEHVGISTHIINEYNRLKARRRKLGIVDEAPPPDQPISEPGGRAYPIFQNLKDCLLAMRLYTEDFLRAHTLYIRTMLDRGAEDKATAPCGFAFDGQFSMVANWSIRSHKTERLVTDIWDTLESDLKLKLTAPTHPWLDAGALVTRLFCERPFSLPIPPSDPVLLGEAAILTAEPHVHDNLPASNTGHPTDTKLENTDKTSPSDSLVNASSSLESEISVNVRTLDEPSITTSPAVEPTGDPTAPAKLEAASSVSAVESLPDVEMTEGDLSSVKLVPRSPEDLSLTPAAPAHKSVEPRPQHSTSMATMNAGSITRSPEAALVADCARVTSTPESSHQPNGDMLTLSMDDLPVDDVPYEDDDSPSTSRAASPSFRDDGPLLPEGVIMDRNMLVEVEVRVSEDKSNKFIPGHRIAIRFRLVV